jgi:thymidylate synthase (FAD)
MIGIKVKTDDKYAYVTMNYRHIIENGWLDDLQYICEPTEFHEKRVTVHFTTQIAITREFNRHRVNSIAEQSTRYCNYSNDKFNGEVSINLPNFISDISESYISDKLSKDYLKKYCDTIAYEEDDTPYLSMNIIDYWLFANLACEYSYLNMIRLGAKPQEARTILPLDTNTELIHTAFISDWKHFFDLRLFEKTGKVHPDMLLLAEKAKKALEEKNLWGLIYKPN